MRSRAGRRTYIGHFCMSLDPRFSQVFTGMWILFRRLNQEQLIMAQSLTVCRYDNIPLDHDNLNMSVLCDHRGSVVMLRKIVVQTPVVRNVAMQNHTSVHHLNLKKLTPVSTRYRRSILQYRYLANAIQTTFRKYNLQNSVDLKPIFLPSYSKNTLTSYVNYASTRHFIFSIC